MTSTAAPLGDTCRGLWEPLWWTMLERPLLVVPVDSSSDATVAYAFALAKRHGADVHLLQVVRPRRPSVFDSPDLALAGQTSSSHAPDQVDEPPPSEELTAMAARNGVHVRNVTHKGRPARAIAAYAQLAGAAVIVIDQHYGSPVWRRSAAIASRLGRSASVPVMIVPPANGDKPLQTGPFVNVVLAVDFTVASALALGIALDLVRASGGRVTMIHALKNAPGRMVFSGSEASNAIDKVKLDAAAVAARLRREIPAAEAEQVDVRVTTGDPHRGILDVASEVQADLIVMGVPPRGRVEEVLFGSTLRGVLRRATSPVLVLPVVAGAHGWLVGPS
jgi:nucleotide-binding universal stress UspA family protein